MYTIVYKGSWEVNLKFSEFSGLALSKILRTLVWKKIYMVFLQVIIFQKLSQVIIFVQALRLCLSANQYTLCSLLIKGQTPKQQAIQRLRICLYVWGG